MNAMRAFTSLIYGFRLRSTQPTDAISISTSGAKDKSLGDFPRFLDATRYEYTICYLPLFEKSMSSNDFAVRI